MPPNLGRIPIQTLACGAVIIGGAVVSGAIAADATTIGVGTATVLMGLVGSLSGLGR